MPADVMHIHLQGFQERLPLMSITPQTRTQTSLNGQVKYGQELANGPNPSAVAKSCALLDVSLHHLHNVNAWLMGVWSLQLPVDNTPDNGPPASGAQPTAIPAPVIGALPAGAHADPSSYAPAHELLCHLAWNSRQWCTCMTLIACFDVRRSPRCLQTSLRRFLGPPLVPCDLATVATVWLPRPVQANAPTWLEFSWNVLLDGFCHLHSLSMKKCFKGPFSICMTNGCGGGVPTLWLSW